MTYNDNNQILTETAGTALTQYFYDTNGNTIEKEVDGTVTSYVYDVSNRLVSVDTSGSLVSFEYDADGARVSKTVDGVAVEYLLDKNQRYHQVLEERTDSGALIAEYVYGIQRISMTRGGDERFYHYDGHGSTSELTDSNGLMTDEYSYEAFGNLIASSGIGINPFLYTGEAWDAETGMEYLRARYYSPENGRFVNMDSHPGNQQMPLTLNKYSYGNGNPLMFVDPSGEFSIIEAMTVVSVISVLSTIPKTSYSQISRNLYNAQVDKERIPVIGQPNSRSCWIASIAAMMSYKKNVNLSIPQALAQMHQSWTTLYNDPNDTFIDWDMYALGVEIGATLPLSFTPTVAGFANLIRNNGPLFTVINYAPFHAVVLYRVQGDGSGWGTEFEYMDPANGGTRQTDRWMVFKQKFVESHSKPHLPDTQLMHY